MMRSICSSHSSCSCNHRSHICVTNIQYYSTTAIVATYVKVLCKYCSITTTVTTSVELLCNLCSIITTAATPLKVLCNHTVQQQQPLLLKYCASTAVQQPQKPHLLKYCPSTAVQQPQYLYPINSGYLTIHCF